ncbi:ROK family protein [uncultured Cyclobacterium sp.]|uniref:ROK family protein n=1 Tax=uncultured Cyclobacterium sp. TaxID=453820 RepID=UPI0030ED36FE|tara:strand:+ start:203955 stop:204878 length:924 start_codon:yes stop_codon:yes gene_type:complete
MDKKAEMFLGIDVGGTHVKIGLIDTLGQIIQFGKEDTTLLRKNPQGFNSAFVEVVGKYLKKYPEVKHVGIGLPGLVSKDRTTTLEIPAISELNGFKLKDALLEKYPEIIFHLENDASAAALGEFHFGKQKTADNYLFITLGTGIGSALILDRKVFKGVRGNAMEVGHMLSRGNSRLEPLIGRNGILTMAGNMMKQFPQEIGEMEGKELGIHLLVASAKNGNGIALRTFAELGAILGEALVSTIRILDVTEVYFGGGISAALPFIQPQLEKTIHQYLSPYYLSDLKLEKATLENDAGTLGAAALCFMD